MYIFVLFMLASDGSNYHISDTGIFQVMRPSEVFVRPNGEVFLLNFDDAQVLHYDASGTLKQEIGRKGRGPGEFTFPTYMGMDDQHIYIFDLLTEQISTFTLDGTFLESFGIPKSGTEIVRAQKGWFFYEVSMKDMGGAPANLEWTVDQFKSREKIHEIPTTGWGQGMWSNFDGKTMRATYSPMAVKPRMISSSDGKRLYFADAETFKIDVFDGASGKHLYTIQDDKKRLPFDTDWADERAEKRSKDLRKRYPGATINKRYPKYFPAIRALMFDPHGNLVVDRWRGRPDAKHYFTCFDDQGKETTCDYTYKTLRRIVGSVGDNVFVLMFEEDVDAGLARVPLKQVDQFIKDNPISDWSQSRSISISN